MPRLTDAFDHDRLETPLRIGDAALGTWGRHRIRGPRAVVRGLLRPRRIIPPTIPNHSEARMPSEFVPTSFTLLVAYVTPPVHSHVGGLGLHVVDSHLYVTDLKRFHCFCLRAAHESSG
ncbi:hypothetical protein GY45DRAFT_381383 [Cubamyces sp. BRFM 1775]|nr:hypothetical protein GY45DRAFT_381383 [Cubamyces sp. BRFM 1775]